MRSLNTAVTNVLTATLSCLLRQLGGFISTTVGARVSIVSPVVNVLSTVLSRLFPARSLMPEIRTV